MEIFARLALFTTTLVLAVVGGWCVGQLVGPVPSLTSPAAGPALTDVHSPSPHLHLEHP